MHETRTPFYYVLYVNMVWMASSKLQYKREEKSNITLKAVPTCSSDAVQAEDGGGGEGPAFFLFVVTSSQEIL